MMVRTCQKLAGLKALRSERGSAIIWGLVIIGVIAQLSILLPNYFTQLGRSQKAINIKASANLVRENVIALLDNDAAIYKTAEGNPQLSCLINPGTNCSSTPVTGFRVIEGDGTEYVGTSPSSGLDMNGRPCQQFNATSGHETCVFKLVVRAECNPCGPSEVLRDGAGNPVSLISHTPKFRFIGELQYAPRNENDKTQIAAQSVSYRIDFTRSEQKNTIASTCAAIQGTYNPSTQKCVVPASAFGGGLVDCKANVGSHTWFIGFDADGTPQCDADIKVGLPCPPGQGVVGLNRIGNLVCGPY